MKFLEVGMRPWPPSDWLVALELSRRIRGNEFLERRKKWFDVKNTKGTEVVLERRVQEYKLLRE